MSRRILSGFQDFLNSRKLVPEKKVSLEDGL